MKYDVFNKDGKKNGQTLLPKEIFEVKPNLDLIYQAVVTQRANKRKVIAHTKTRSEVSGGGRKPWRQKGLGRARHGSIRSPIWVGGGITFGPRKGIIFKKRFPKKMKRKALFMVLSQKAKKGFLILLNELDIEKTKTKLMTDIFEKLPSKEGSSLLALPKIDKKVILATRNIPKTNTIQAKDLNCLDILTFKYLIMPKESIKVIKETFLKSN
ncbi:MAG: 50S ribosomal protein L4 [Patescibacteria group bacterium]|nr:50S ribosomal protein L4 [Patescibacteria group bacterium]